MESHDRAVEHSDIGPKTHDSAGWPPLPQVLQSVCESLGFHPAEALVVVVYEAGHHRIRAVWRIDLLGDLSWPALDDARRSWWREAVRACDQSVFADDLVFVLEYPIDESQTRLRPDVSRALARHNNRLRTALVDYLGDSVAAGVRQHRVTPAQRQQAAYVTGGLVAGDRGELEAEVRRHSMALDTPPPGLPLIDDALIDMAIDHIVNCLTGETPPSPADEHLLAAGLVHVRVRDTALWDLLALNPVAMAVAAPRLASIAQTTWPRSVPGVATVLGILRWQLGDDVRAAIAINIALQCDTDYRLAVLVSAAIRSGVPRHQWRHSLLALGRAKCRNAPGT